MTATANGNNRIYNPTSHEKGELQAWWQGPWERNGIRVDVLRRYHRFELAAKAKFDPSGAIFQKLVAGAEVIDQRNGTIRQWRVWQVQEFKLILGNSGKVRYMPAGWGPRIAAALFHCLVEKLGFTLVEFREFCSRLRLARVEIANQVTENSKGVLVPGKIATVIFEDLPTIPPATIVLKDDLSKGLMELETSGSAPEAEDVHLMVCNPAVAEGYIRQIRDRQQQDAPVLKQIAEQGARAEVNQAQMESHIIQEIQKPWHAISTTNKDHIGMTTLLASIDKKLDGLKPGMDQDGVKPIVTAIKIAASRTVNAINKLSNTFEEKLEEVHVHLEENNDEAELRNTDLSNDMAEQHLEEKVLITGVLDQARQNNRDIHQVDLHQQIYAEGILENQREIKRLLLGYHQGQIFQTAFLTRRIQALDDRMASIADVLSSLAKQFNMTLADLVKLTSDTRDEIERVKQQLGGNRIHQDSLNYLSLALILLGKFPSLVVKRIAEMLGIKPTRVYGMINKLEELGFVTREKRVPDMDPITAGPEPPSQDFKPAKKKPSLRKVWNIFRRQSQSESKTQSNEQIKPEDEKT